MNEDINNNNKIDNIQRIKMKSNKLLYFAIGLIIIGLILIILSSFITKDKDKNADNNSNSSANDDKFLISEKKKTTMNTINSFINYVTININNMEYGALSNPDVLYYIPVSNIAENSCVTLERGGSDSLGNWEEAYVVVSYDVDYFSYNYYFTFYDDAGYGVELTKRDDFLKDGSNITNPIPENAKPSNITKQLDGKASSIKILLTPAEAKEAGVEACTIYTAKDI